MSHMLFKKEEKMNHLVGIKRFSEGKDHMQCNDQEKSN